MQRTDRVRPALLFLALFSLACAREEKRPERTAPWLASASASIGSATPGARRVRYAIAKADVRFELPAKHATPRGRFPDVSGELEVDLASPERTSGTVRVDLSRIELDGSGAVAPDPERTARALDWLELGAGIPEAERAPRRFATFVVHGLEGAEGRDVRGLGGRQTKEGRSLPHLELLAFGELSLHGVRAPERVPISVEVVPGAAPESPPARLLIRSRRPLVVPLGVHDIRPRDTRGVFVARELQLLGESVGREAKVSFELDLAPGP